MHFITLAAATMALGALTAQAFHVESGTACTTVGASCSYISDDSSTGGSATTTVNGFCAPSLLCASNGASCSSDDQCYDYCGTDGICGGEGAGCNTQAAFAVGQAGIACNTPQFTCTTNGSTGVCKAATTSSQPQVGVVSGASMRARRHKKRIAEFHENQVRAADLRRTL